MDDILRPAPALLMMLALTATACGGAPDHGTPTSGSLHRPVPRIARGPAYRYAPSGVAATAARPVAGMHCRRDAGEGFGVHLEAFANGLDVVIPAGA